jgi:hypothetical protein
VDRGAEGGLGIPGTLDEKVKSVGSRGGILGDLDVLGRKVQTPAHVPSPCPSSRTQRSDGGRTPLQVEAGPPLSSPGPAWKL